MVNLEGPNHQDKPFGVYHQPLELPAPTVTLSSGIYSLIRTGKLTGNPAGTSSVELTQPPQEFDQISDSHQHNHRLFHVQLTVAILTTVNKYTVILV